jgi:tetratricopeptide (TPR) repeat protein
MTIDPGLLEAISARRAVLFLGAGASLGAKRANGTLIPDAAGLGTLLSKNFLNPAYDNADFKTIYDFSCSARSILDVQDFIHQTLIGCHPAPFHRLIPTFAWAGVATTNYDLVLERAYEGHSGSLQTLLPNCKDGDGVPEALGPNGLLYVKLHGCITHYRETSPPMIASTEQIINHKDGRAGQFAQFLEWAKTKTIVFAGYGLGDFNLRILLEEIRKDGDAHPRHFIVRPNILSLEADYWADRRMRTLSLTFEDFLTELDNSIPTTARRLTLLPAASHASSFTRFISKPEITESASLLRYLSTQCEHVSSISPTTPSDPARFYKGFDLGWYPFTSDLDVPRRISHAILDERISPNVLASPPQLFVIKGHAGSGKSVILRRIAWDAANKYDRLVFRVQAGGDLDKDAFDELFNLTNCPIYLFIDDIADDCEHTVSFLQHAKRRKWPIVIIASARIHEWNIRCDDLKPLATEEYELKYLTDKEIDALLGKLEQHNALGFLKSLTFDSRKLRLKEIYGRQLLVALHEATENATFSEIIRDEYAGLSPPEAKLLYLDICSLHRFGPPVRAGLISRVHGIDFEDFRARFFSPLEQVVDLAIDSKTQDWTYKARHSVIADIVYKTALPTVVEKFDNLMRIVGKLNPSYSYDNEVLFQLIRSSTLAEIFPDRTMGEAIYTAAKAAFGELPMILHQQGVYEMRRAGDSGGLDRAQLYLEDAQLKATNDASIKHSLAELALKRSTIAPDQNSREIWRRRSESQARELAAKGRSSYPLHTLAKVAIARVKEALETVEQNDDELGQEVLGVAIKDAEDVLRNGLKLFPNDDRLLTEEATLGEILQNADRALKALRKATAKNPRSELIARRLSRILSAKGDFDGAIDVLRNTLALNPGSQILHYDLAMAIMASSPAADVQQGETVLYHLHRSFTRGDKNFEARFWYARQLCITGKGNDATSVFAELKHAHVPFSQRRSLRGVIKSTDGSNASYYGHIYAKRSTFGFVRADQDRSEIFIPADILPKWETLPIGQRVQYNLAFNLDGPIAFNAIVL